MAGTVIRDVAEGVRPAEIWIRRVHERPVGLERDLAGEWGIEENGGEDVAVRIGVVREQSLFGGDGKRRVLETREGFRDGARQVVRRVDDEGDQPRGRCALRRMGEINEAIRPGEIGCGCVREAAVRTEGERRSMGGRSDEARSHDVLIVSEDSRRANRQGGVLVHGVCVGRGGEQRKQPNERVAVGVHAGRVRVGAGSSGDPETLPAPEICRERQAGARRVQGRDEGIPDATLIAGHERPGEGEVGCVRVTDDPGVALGIHGDPVAQIVTEPEVGARPCRSAEVGRVNQRSAVGLDLRDERIACPTAVALES